VREDGGEKKRKGYKEKENERRDVERER